MMSTITGFPSMTNWGGTKNLSQSLAEKVQAQDPEKFSPESKDSGPSTGKVLVGAAGGAISGAALLYLSGGGIWNTAMTGAKIFGTLGAVGLGIAGMIAGAGDANKGSEAAGALVGAGLGAAIGGVGGAVVGGIDGAVVGGVAKLFSAAGIAAPVAAGAVAGALIAAALTSVRK
ncbi:MAG: hypothetical protein HYU64_02880 [Armatimonadetes bacterium]|nr:hypothetical protein [Armatimonadota bacterium]